MDGLPRIETLDRTRCLELLADASVGRLAFVVPPGPEGAERPEPPGLVPLNYLLDGVGGPDGQESVVLRTTLGSRLGRAVLGALVTFEVDDLRSPAQEGWSVVVSGRVRQVEDPGELARLGRSLPVWAPGFKELFLRLPLERVSGRRVLSRDRVIELPGSPAPRWRTPEGWAPPTRTSATYTTDFDGR